MGVDVGSGGVISEVLQQQWWVVGRVLCDAVSKRCYDVHDVLCNKKMLEDNYSSFKGYYEEAYVELGTSSRSLASHSPGPVVCKKNGPRLMQPDKRVGFPF